ncbi:MAG: 3-hydroxyacyl-CoA dehydrogenase family protein [Sedimentisphaerales bacterium]|nr:3-hydroxyacyl-CoA dehydrogenase family protein [Sedimentisphaerales bacterium]
MSNQESYRDNEKIKTVVVLGASGTIGSLSGGLMAQNGLKVYFLSRTQQGSERGLQKAISQARSEMIARNVICGDYEHLLGQAISETDWVVEAIAEDVKIKQQLYERVESYRKPQTIVSSTTSSLPLNELIEGRSEGFKKHFLSTHFFNPPGRMSACEITGTEFTDPNVVDFMRQFLKKRLRRAVISVKNTVAFAGNRIAFVLFSRITTLASEFGVETMDYLIGPYTGRLLPPLATLDLVGLDIHKAIIDSLKTHTKDAMHRWLTTPGYINMMIQKKLLGNKTGCGFYRKLESGKFVFLDPVLCDYVPAIEPHVAFVEKAKHFTHMGMYKEAFETILTAQGKEAEVVKNILCAYIAYSYSLVGEVTDSTTGVEGIDKVMAYGFNWAPPSVIMEALGGSEIVTKLLKERGFAIPQSLQIGLKSCFNITNSGKYFVAK